LLAIDADVLCNVVLIRISRPPAGWNR